MEQESIYNPVSHFAADSSSPYKCAPFKADTQKFRDKERERNFLGQYKKIAVIGCGAAGGLVSILLAKNPYNKVSAFDTNLPFTSLLPTGGGRCNLTYDEPDIKEFVKNYPRGEKFLLSVFSRFSQADTRKLFEDLGIKTYVQADKRVFPISDSSKKTVEILRKHLETSNFTFIKEKVTGIKREPEGFIVTTDSKKYNFDFVIMASGGKGTGFEIAKSTGHNIVELKPSLCALDIREKYLYNLAGMSFKNVEIKAGKYTCCGDILFAHKFITGPCILKVSSLSAYSDVPFYITLKLSECSKEEIEGTIKNNQKKSIKNVFSKYAPENFIQEILTHNNIDGLKQIAQIKKSEKDILIDSLISLKLQVQGMVKNSEIVTAGGVDLKEINPKTMESKLVKGLYFIGEILNIDGFTGGFNLQNCWSGAVICSNQFCPNKILL